MKLSTAQQRLLLDLLEQGATGFACRTSPATYKKACTVHVLKRLGLVAEDRNLNQPRYYSLHFTPAGVSIARELRRMRFQEPQHSAVRT